MRLLLGNGLCAQSARTMRQARVTHVLNMSGGELPNYFEAGRPKQLTWKQEPEDHSDANRGGGGGGGGARRGPGGDDAACYDSSNLQIAYGTLSLDEQLKPGSTESIRQFEAAVAFIENALASSDSSGSAGSVLVHCRTGVSVSPAVILAYLIKTQKCGLDAALARLSRKRFVRPSAPLIAQLRGYCAVDQGQLAGAPDAAVALSTSHGRGVKGELYCVTGAQ